MRHEAITGLTHGQLIELTARVREEITDVARSGGRPAVIGLFRSVALVVALMRKNLTQEAAGCIFGCSQWAASRFPDRHFLSYFMLLPDCSGTGPAPNAM